MEITAPQVSCPRCGQSMRLARVKTTIWQDEHLFVVEDVPAQVCDNCLEQYYDDETTDSIRRLTEARFSSLMATREIVVPVFSIGRAALPTDDNG